MTGGGALSLFISISLGFFVMGGGDGSDIIVVVLVIGFSRSYDSGLCCFIGSIIPRGGSVSKDGGSNAVRIQARASGRSYLP